MVNFNKNNIKFWAGLLFAQFLLFYLLSKTSFGVSFAETFFEFKKKFHQSLFSELTFSFGDLIYAILVIYLIFCLYKILYKKSRKRYLLKILIIINIFYFVYQLFWGLLYFQTPIIEKLPKKELSDDKIKLITLHYIDLCNKNRKQLHENEKGVFTIKDIETTKNTVLQNQLKIPKIFYNKKYIGINNFKPSISGKLNSYTGILGYYNPFTSEAQYNPYIPSSYIPFTLAHESAHQLGFAREQEANFIAYLICKNSNNPELQYSANLYVVKTLLNTQLETDPEFAEKAKILLSDAVNRDLENNKKFYEEHTGWVNDFFYFTNDLFLKSNRQEGSITYSYFIELILRYER